MVLFVRIVFVFIRGPPFSAATRHRKIAMYAPESGEENERKIFVYPHHGITNITQLPVRDVSVVWFSFLAM